MLFTDDDLDADLREHPAWQQAQEDLHLPAWVWAAYAAALLAGIASGWVWPNGVGV